MNAIDRSNLGTRVSPIERRASMQRFERLVGRVLLMISGGLAIAMAAFICMTTHLLG